MENQEPTNSEILEAINAFSSKNDERLQKIESTMVTKDYLDDKLTDLRGDLVVLVRKEDTKLKTLVSVLKNKNIISEEDVKTINALEPFPQLSL
ncbi:MAG: hypothetical protein WC323_04460 [Patescibacteria group bacterium]|jgi:hypothetical protein